MPIYTKAGDDGTTVLFGGRRVIKSDPQIKAYGSVDELSSFVGLLIAKNISSEDKDFLTRVQHNLYTIMSMLSGSQVKNRLNLEVERLEKKIDSIEKKLPELTHFILPQGNELTSLIHIARTVCRRAEREVVDCFKKIQNPSASRRTKFQILKYLNRLSDFLFILARHYNKKEIFAHK